MRFSRANLFLGALLAILLWGYFAGFQINILNYFSRFFFHTNALQEENLNLRLENEKLKAQLGLGSTEKETWLKGLEYRPATIFSTYPFNNQRVLAIALGSEDGLKKSMPVVAAPGILLGQVIEVFPKYSLVKTIFDPDFKIPVRIGAAATDALLEGGNQPMVTLINKNTLALSGDFVYSAGVQFPYRMQIGILAVVSDFQDNFLKKAELKINYNINELKKVYVIVNFSK